MLVWAFANADFAAARPDSFAAPLQDGGRPSIRKSENYRQPGLIDGLQLFARLEAHRFAGWY